jgi:hypothetical protein
MDCCFNSNPPAHEYRFADHDVISSVVTRLGQFSAHEPRNPT